MSFFNTNAIAIMLKPLLAKWIEPLEENGTLDRIAADVQMLSDEGAIPALSELVRELKSHNALLRDIREILKADDRTYHAGAIAAPLAIAGPGTSGYVRVDGAGMPEHNGAD